MRFEDFRAGIPEAIFDMAFVRQRFGTTDALKASMAVQLTRWEQRGKIKRLRRGLYVVADVEPNTLLLANRLVEPSYISGEYALSYYGLIQDATFEVTSACLIAPRRGILSPGFARYSYRQVKVYNGFESLKMDGDGVLFATPEKALIDTWHWLPGRWTRERHEGMRYENTENVDAGMLMHWAKEFASPRLKEAVSVYCVLKKETRHAA